MIPRPRLPWPALAGLALSLLLGSQALASSDVPAGRLQRLARGVNLSEWFSQIPVKGGAYTHAWFASYDTPADLELLARSGFTHVRFPVEFEMFMDEDNPDTPRPEFLPDFDAAIDHILASGLSVIVDWHAREDTKNRLRSDDVLALKAALLWGAMAKHLSVRDPERVFLETMNEPAGKMSLERWTWVQNGLVTSMRTNAPRHTIIVTSNHWSGVGDLAKLAPLPDRNIVYNFHFYEPMAETHQGATWTQGGEEALAGVAYPVDEAQKAAQLAALTNPGARKTLEAYHGDRAWVAARMKIAFDWGKANGVPLTCNEFGVYNKVSPPDSRLRWITDVRQLCEENAAGWCMWDYAGGFGFVTTGADGKRAADPGCVKALGLHPEATP